MLYNRHGRRQIFAMYAKFSAWMNDYFHNFKGFSLRISFLGSRAWWIGLLLSIIHFKLLLFQTSKNLTFFPSSIFHNINWLPPPTSTSLNRKTYFVQRSPTWPCVTLFRYLGFLLNYSCLCKTKFVVFKMQNISITWLRHSWSPTKYNNNPVWRQLKKWYNFLLQHRNFDTVRFVIMDITNGRVA